MFGFKGHWKTVHETEATGLIDANIRHMGWLVLAKYGTVAEVPGGATAEWDLNGDGAPDQILENTSTPYDGLKKKVRITGIHPTMASNSASERIFALYTGVDLLTPRTRKQQLTIFRPDLISKWRLGIIKNNLQSVDDNFLEGPLEDDFSGLVFCEEFSVTESYVTEIKSLPPNIKTCNVDESVALIKMPPIPESCEKIYFAKANNTLMADVNNIIASCINCKDLAFSQTSPFPVIFANVAQIEGALDISHMPKLERLIIWNSRVTDISVPDRFDFLETCALGFNITAGFDGFNNSDAIEKMFASPKLTGFQISLNLNLVWNKDFDNNNITDQLKDFEIYRCKITGTVNITAPRPNLERFRLGGITVQNDNVFSQVDIRGLTNCKFIDLAGCDCEDLVLPTNNTTVTDLYLHSNKLSISQNPNLKKQIETMSSLKILYLGNPNSTLTELPSFGQDSLDGFGSDLDLRILTDLVVFSCGSCKLSGTITLPSNEKLNTLDCSNNENLMLISNFADQTAIVSLRYQGCPELDLDLSTKPNITNFTCAGSGQIILDISQRTRTQAFGQFDAQDCLKLTKVILPANAQNAIFGSLAFSRSPLLNEIQNLENVSLSTIRGDLFAAGCSLDIDFKLGVNSFIPQDMFLDDNNMSETNVDININSVYENRTKWNTLLAKRLFIAGNNAAPSGTYQAPSGFVEGSEDGNPASPKEKAYVLEKNYSFTVNMN